MGFNTEQTKRITASFFQEVCHAVLRVPVPMIHSDCHINEGDEEKQEEEGGVAGVEARAGCAHPAWCSPCRYQSPPPAPCL